MNKILNNIIDNKKWLSATIIAILLLNGFTALSVIVLHSCGYLRADNLILFIAFTVVIGIALGLRVVK